MKIMVALMLCLAGCGGAAPEPIPPEDAGQDVDEAAACVACSLCLFQDGGPQHLDCVDVCSACMPTGGCTPCSLCRIGEGLGQCTIEGQCAVNTPGCYGSP